MSGICGFVARERTEHATASVDSMLQVFAQFRHARIEKQVVAPGVCFARVARAAAIERHETTHPWQEGDWSFVAEARLDEPDELARRLDRQMSAGRDDARLLAALVRQSLTRSDDRLLATSFGDWSMAAWHTGEGRLYLVREPIGFDALYYVQTDFGFAFASTMAALLSLTGFSRELDELTLARSMTGFLGGKQDNCTIFPSIRYLPPGQVLTVNGQTIDRRRYFRMEEEIVDQPLSFDAAAERLRDHIDKAVASRLTDVSTAAATLSSGLDSSGVVATASAHLARHGRVLNAYCAVPHFADRCAVPKGRHPDEWQLAASLAERLPNVQLKPIDSSATTPIQGIERSISLLARPAYATSNDYWLHALHGEAASDGNPVVLNGGFGNITMSYGYLANQRALSLLRHGRFRVLASRARQSLRCHLSALTGASERAEKMQWSAYSCIAPGFAIRLKLAQKMEQQQRDPRSRIQRFSSSREERLHWFDPLHGSNVFQDMLVRVHGVDILDPSADSQLSLFTLGLSERQFTGPHQQPRWLYKTAMKDRLPDFILDAGSRGYQSADLIARLRADAERMDELLAQLETHPFSREIIDLDRMRLVWSHIQENASISSHKQAWTILLNGAAVGIFILRFC